jgi:hypothetical protein
MVMGSPSRNNPHRFAALCEHYKECLTVHFTNRLVAFLAIVAPPVYTHQSVRVGKHPRRMGKIKAALRIRPAALPIVPLEYHMGGIAV